MNFVIGELEKKKKTIILSTAEWWFLLHVLILFNLVSPNFSLKPNEAFMFGRW